MIYRINLHTFTSTGALNHVGSVSNIPDNLVWELEDKFDQGSFPIEPELDDFDRIQEICPELYELSQKARTLTSDTFVLLNLDYLGLSPDSEQ